MHKRLVTFFALYCLISGLLSAAEIPKPVGWINDFADVIPLEYKDKITALIRDLEEKSSVELAVVTVDSIAPYDEKEYARLLFDGWKPGKKGKDNGVLILLAIQERLWRIETGYDIEGILPDGLCGEIGRGYMVPYFKESRYGEGLYQGVLKVYNIILKQDYSKTSGSRNEFSLLNILVIIFFAGIWLSFMYASSRYRDKNHFGGSGYYGGYGGGGFGGGGGGGFGGFGGGLGGGGGAGGRF